jgi:hypothetical protein
LGYFWLIPEVRPAGATQKMVASGKDHTGAYALVITANTPGAVWPMRPTTVEAVFVFGRQRSS